jgi:hypothetical protein
MKKLILVLIISALFGQFSYGQDTLKHITSGCLGHIVSSDSDSCAEGINFRYLGNTLEIYGTIWANCCGEHFVQIIRLNDTIYITSFDTGRLCNCGCRFCFDIKIPDATNDTIVKFNEVIYNAKKINSIKGAVKNNELIELYPNPAENILALKVPANIRINKIHIKDISGRLVKTIEHVSPVIDIKSLDAGVYFVNFELENQQIIVKRIVKL